MSRLKNVVKLLRITATVEGEWQSITLRRLKESLHVKLLINISTFVADKELAELSIELDQMLLLQGVPGIMVNLLHFRTSSQQVVKIKRQVYTHSHNVSGHTHQAVSHGSLATI
jgi:hypothetical protein